MSSIKVQAQTSFDFNSVEQDCICISENDTNKQKCKVKKNYNQQYKDGKIWVSKINVEYVNKNNNIGTKVTFGKTKKASGYQIGYGATYDIKKSKIIDRKTVSVKKNVKTLSKMYSFIQVRPYRVIKGKRYYGKWSSVYTVGIMPKIPASR